MKNIVLTMKSTQEIDGQSDSTEFMSHGNYSYVDKNAEVIYDESVALGVDNIKTQLTVTENGVVKIVRNDGDFGCLIVEEGKCHHCQYHTAYGNLMIGIYGNKVEYNLTEFGGDITLVYSIEVNSGLLSRNKVEIKIREEKQ